LLRGCDDNAGRLRKLLLRLLLSGGPDVVVLF
jgi:hypothetical protein